MTGDTTNTAVTPSPRRQWTRGRVLLLCRRLLAYTVLILLSFLCLFFFYLLLVNASRAHGDIQTGFSPVPGAFFIENW